VVRAASWAVRFVRVDAGSLRPLAMPPQCCTGGLAWAKQCGAFAGRAGQWVVEAGPIALWAEARRVVG
jgi:hypothetical protein